MPRLANSQRETFAIHYATGSISKAEAARRAGYSPKTADNAGSRLAKLPDVAQRIAEIAEGEQSIADKENSYPAAKYKREPFVVTELVVSYRACKKAKQFSSAIQALRTLAQIGGFLNDGSGSGSKTFNIQQNYAQLGPDAIHELLVSQMQDFPAAVRAQLLEGNPQLAETLAKVEAIDVKAVKDEKNK